MHDFLVVAPNRGHDKLTILIFLFIADSLHENGFGYHFL